MTRLFLFIKFSNEMRLFILKNDVVILQEIDFVFCLSAVLFVNSWCQLWKARQRGNQIEIVFNEFILSFIDQFARQQFQDFINKYKKEYTNEQGNFIQLNVIRNDWCWFDLIQKRKSDLISSKRICWQSNCWINMNVEQQFMV